MKLYAGKIDSISTEIIARLTNDGDIEVTNRSEAELDVASVLKEYLRVDSELTERAKDILEIRGLGYSHFGRTKRSLAEQKDFGLGEEGITWIVNQLLETFMQSQHVDEIYAEDASLRRKIREVLNKHMAVDEELDREVRQRIKNLEEGTQTWEIEYGRVMEQMKQKFGMRDRSRALPRARGKLGSRVNKEKRRSELDEALNDAQNELELLLTHWTPLAAFDQEFRLRGKGKHFRLWNDVVWNNWLHSRDMLVIHLASWSRGVVEKGGLFKQIQASTNVLLGDWKISTQSPEGARYLKAERRKLFQRSFPLRPECLPRRL